MLPVRNLWLALPVALLLAACGSDEEAVAPEKPLTIEEQIARKVPVQSVAKVEMGRTRDGFIITALGTAPGLGYSVPELRPRRDGQPGQDGIIEYDFVATPPSEGQVLPPGTTRARTIRADRAVKAAAFRGARGIRVIAASTALQVDFGPPEGEAEGEAEGDAKTEAAADG